MAQHDDPLTFETFGGPERRAKDLLLRSLDRDQTEQWRVHKWFDVRTERGRFRIQSSGLLLNMTLGHQQCWMPRHFDGLSMPRHDLLLALKLILEIEPNMFFGPQQPRGLEVARRLQDIQRRAQELRLNNLKSPNRRRTY